MNDIVLRSEAESTAARSLYPSSVASHEETNLLDVNNSDNKIDSTELKTTIALYNYYSIAILKDALLTLKGNICTERINKDSKKGPEHFQSPRKVSREASVAKKSTLQKMDEFAATIAKEILQECIAGSRMFTTIGQGPQRGLKHEISSNEAQSMSASHRLDCATVDTGVGEKDLLHSDVAKLAPSCKTVKGEFSALGDARFETLPQRTIPDSQLAEMENIAYLVVSSVIKEAMMNYLKTSHEIQKSTETCNENLIGSAWFETGGPRKQEGKKMHVVTQEKGAADMGSAEFTDNEQAEHGGSNETTIPSNLQRSYGPYAVEPMKTFKVEYGGYSGLIPGNNNVAPQKDKGASRNVCMVSRSEATLLSTSKYIVAKSDQKDMMLTQQSQFTSFLDRMANNVISQGVTVAVVQIQQSGSCQQQKFDMKDNKEGIATEENLLNKGQSNSFEGCVAKQTEKLDVFGWFAEKLMSQLLEK